MSAVLKIPHHSIEQLQEEIQKIQQSYTQKIQDLVLAGKIQEMQSAIREMQEKIQEYSKMITDAVSATVSFVNEDAPDFNSSPSLIIQSEPSTIAVYPSHFDYNHPQCKMDINPFVFSLERNLFENLVRDSNYIQFLDEKIDNVALNHYQHLFFQSIPLHPVAFKNIYNVTESCKMFLEMNFEYEIMLLPDHPKLVDIYPEDEEKLFFFVNSTFLNNYTDQEKTFIMGRQLGHYLLNHAVTPFHAVINKAEGLINPQHFLRLYDWQSFAELTADRFGLLCSQDLVSSFSYFYKHSFSLSEVIDESQFQDCIEQWLHESVSTDVADWIHWNHQLSFHPLRCKALSDFYKSSLFHKKTKSEKDNPSEEDYFTSYSSLIMNTDHPHHKVAKKFLIHAGWSIRYPSYGPDFAYLEYIEKYFDFKTDEIKNWSHEQMQESVQQIISEMKLGLNDQEMCVLFKDLVVVLRSFTKLEEPTYNDLGQLACSLGIRRKHIEKLLQSVIHRSPF